MPPGIAGVPPAAGPRPAMDNPPKARRCSSGRDGPRSQESRANVSSRMTSPPMPGFAGAHRFARNENVVDIAKHRVARIVDVAREVLGQDLARTPTGARSHSLAARLLPGGGGAAGRPPRGRRSRAPCAPGSAGDRDSVLRRATPPRSRRRKVSWRRPRRRGPCAGWRRACRCRPRSLRARPRAGSPACRTPG